MNVGAQKWVIQRVRKSAGSAKSRGFAPLLPKKSRVWSSAISTITRPRAMSIEGMRAAVIAPAGTDRDRSTGSRPWQFLMWLRSLVVAFGAAFFLALAMLDHP